MYSFVYVQVNRPSIDSVHMAMSGAHMSSYMNWGYFMNNDALWYAHTNNISNITVERRFDGW